jgi:hypothetical protein
MPRIDKTIEDTVKILVAEARRQANHSESKFWHNKKIISIKQWEQLRKDLNDEEMLDFIPDEHVEWPFGFMNIPFMSTAKYQKWFTIWRQYLISKKDPKLGRRLCHGCILNEESDMSIWGLTYPTSTSIRDVILKHPSAKEFKFGCPTNVFRCPYKQLDQNEDLFELAEIWEIVHNAIMEAHHRTHYGHDMFFEIDFIRKIAFVQRQWYHDPTSERIADALHFHKLSVVEIRTIEDIFNTLTNPKLLELILEQYTKEIENGEAEYTGKPKQGAAEKAIKIRENKGPILKFFAELKDEIKLDHLRDLYDQPQEIEDEEKNRRGEIDAYLVSKHPTHEKYLKKKRNSTCVSCSKFSNIHCLNCQEWICDEHWKEHGRSKHNFVV